MNKVRLSASTIVVISALCVFGFIIGIVIFFNSSFYKTLVNNYIEDYYGEYKYYLPFKFKFVMSYNGLTVKSDLTFEEIGESIKNDGAETHIILKEAEQTLYFSVQNKGKQYNFVVMQVESNENIYIFNRCEALVLDESGNSNSENVYNHSKILFPIYFAQLSNWGGGLDLEETRVIYCSFDELANFYIECGRDDYSIDYGNQTILFDIKDIDKQVLIEYTESDTNSYVNASIVV